MGGSTIAVRSSGWMAEIHRGTHRCGEKKKEVGLKERGWVMVPWKIKGTESQGKGAKEVVGMG